MCSCSTALIPGVRSLTFASNHACLNINVSCLKFTEAPLFETRGAAPGPPAKELTVNAPRSLRPYLRRGAIAGDKQGDRNEIMPRSIAWRARPSRVSRAMIPEGRPHAITLN